MKVILVTLLLLLVPGCFGYQNKGCVMVDPETLCAKPPKPKPPVVIPSKPPLPPVVVPVEPPIVIPPESVNPPVVTPVEPPKPVKKPRPVPSCGPYMWYR
jgi:hypothetical protein